MLSLPLFPVVKHWLFRRLAFYLVCGITITICGVAQAYLVIQPELSTTNAYDDNPRLRLQDASAVLFTKNQVLLDTTYIGPTYEFGITPKFRLSRFTEETELDSEEYFVSTFANKLFERHQVQAAFDFERQASFSTEVDDSGIFDINLFRTTLSSQINWSYFVSERLTLLFNGYATDVSFEEDPRSDFVDYFLYGVGASINYKFSEATSFWAIFGRSNFKTPQLSSETESYSFQLGFDHELTETTDVSFRIGSNRSHLEFKQSQLTLLSLNPLIVGPVLVDGEENQSGDIVQLAVDKEFSRAELRMQWDRRFSPSSLGARQEIEEVYGYLRYKLTRFTHLVGRVRYNTRVQEGALNTTRVNNLERLRYGARLLHRLSPTLVAEVGYRYQDQTVRGLGFTGESHQLSVALRYRPSELRFW